MLEHFFSGVNGGKTYAFCHHSMMFSSLFGNYHYLFLLYAINVASVGAQGLTFNQVMGVIQNDVVGATSIIGTFHLPQYAEPRAKSKKRLPNSASESP